ncbi:DEAD/DEAH box helicase [Rubrolithibacter danxiaensis]|uniref:DEAD/DEAH box helicase n=1 Tax=Rubrolithibacter danxiaensis TaxID=3390805 RepID=UPI003BF82154
MSFEKLNLSVPVLKALKTEGYTHPTPIQEQAIPVVLERKDLLACAQTGTGKTAAFALPILTLLANKNSGSEAIRTLILSPTRELAIQIGESFTSYGKHTELRHRVVFGGVPVNNQISALKNGTDILIATPGRLLDLVTQKAVNLAKIQILVLDEADRMLDMGFINDVKKIIAKLPQKRQTLFFSATMPAEISGLAYSILNNPAKVEVTPVSSTAEKISQRVYMVEKKDKPSLLIHLLKDKSMETILVFTRTKHGADKLVKILNRAGITADAIHGNKSQNARQKALGNFKEGRIRVLVATDIAARGIDVEELKYVVNFELPNLPETYVHRIGRTGRAGLSGTALSFCDLEEREYLQDINKLTAQSIPVIKDHPYPLLITGPVNSEKEKKQKAKRPFKQFKQHKRKKAAA